MRTDMCDSTGMLNGKVLSICKHHEMDICRVLEVIISPHILDLALDVGQWSPIHLSRIIARTYQRGWNGFSWLWIRTGSGLL